jgi:hypothetical protein
VRTGEDRANKVLGTLLITGYFGGAAVTHIIGGESFIPPLIIGFCVWDGAAPESVRLTGDATTKSSLREDAGHTRLQRPCPAPITRRR